VKFNEVKITWSAAKNPNGAEKAGDILSTINPMATCHAQLSAFIKTIDTKLNADEKARWQFKMKQYADKIAAQKEQMRIAEEKGKRDDVYRENQSVRNLELNKINASAYRDVAVARAKNQPKTITYNNILWR